MLNQIKNYYPHIATGIICLFVGSVFTYATAKVSSSPASKTKAQAVQYIQPVQAEYIPVATPKPLEKSLTASAKSISTLVNIPKPDKTLRLSQERDLAICWQGYFKAKDVRSLTDKELNDSLYECKQLRPYLGYDHK